MAIQLSNDIHIHNLNVGKFWVYFLNNYKPLLHMKKIVEFLFPMIEEN